jgi:hypothetical protein
MGIYNNATWELKKKRNLCGLWLRVLFPPRRLPCALAEILPPETGVQANSRLGLSFPVKYTNMAQTYH